MLRDRKRGYDQTGRLDLGHFLNYRLQGRQLVQLLCVCFMFGLLAGALVGNRFSWTVSRVRNSEEKKTPAVLLARPTSPTAFTVAAPLDSEKIVCVLVEERDHPNLIPVMRNIREHIPTCVMQVFYGEENHGTLVKELRNDIFAGKAILTPIGDVDISTYVPYSVFVTREAFWEKISIENVLMYQLDSAICSKSNFTIHDFTEYDYVGAPVTWNFHVNDPIDRIVWPGTNGRGGNGGFSFRKKSAMLKRIRTLPFDAKRKYPLEDLYFSEDETMYFPPIAVAATFSLSDRPPSWDKLDFFPHPFAVHKPTVKGTKREQLLRSCPEVEYLETTKWPEKYRASF